MKKSIVLINLALMMAATLAHARPTAAISCQTVGTPSIRVVGSSELAADYVNGKYRYNINAAAYRVGSNIPSQLKGYVEIESISISNKAQLNTTMELVDASSTLPQFMFRYILNQQYMNGKITGTNSYGRFIQPGPKSTALDCNLQTAFTSRR